MGLFSIVKVQAGGLVLVYQKQPKLTDNTQDAFEQEADNVARQVMPTPDLEGACAHSETSPKYPKGQGDKERFQSYHQPWSVPRAIYRPLEQALGHNLSDVKIHSDENAVRRVRDVGAMALTTGRRIMLDRERVTPDSSAGRYILTHELVHVVQQATIPQAPRVQAYRPQPAPESEEGGVYYSPSDIHVVLGEIFNTQSRYSSEYQSALQRWPTDHQIWPHLSSRQARIEFIRALLEFDRTNCRPHSASRGRRQERGCENFARSLETFQCLGFATQLHIRFRDQPAPPDAEQIERLRSRARIFYEEVEPKYRIPILIVSALHIRPRVIPHAFNAVLVDQNPSNIDSYVFIEPQNDVVFEPSSSQFHRECLTSTPITFSEMSEISESGEIVRTDRRRFVESASGDIIELDLTESEANALRDLHAIIFITEYGNLWQERVRDPSNYVSYVRRLSGHLADDDIVEAAPYLIDRHFRRSPSGPRELLTIDTLLRLIDREPLRQRLELSYWDMRLRQEPSTPERPPPERTTPPGTELV